MSKAADRLRRLAEIALSNWYFPYERPEVKLGLECIHSNPQKWIRSWNLIQKAPHANSILYYDTWDMLRKLALKAGGIY